LILKTKQIGKDAIVYGIGSILSRSMHLIALPIFTRLFSPGEYAFIDMLAVINMLLGAIIGLGFHFAQGIYFFEEEQKNTHARKELIATIFRARLIWGVGVVFVCTLCFPIFNSLFFGNRLPWQYFALAFTGSLFMQMSSQFASLFQLFFRPWTSSLVTIFQACGSMAIAICIVLLFEVGVFGVIVATLIGSIFSAVFGWWMARDYLDLSLYNSAWLSRLSRFGLPLLPLALADWLIMNLDRILVMNMLGPEAMGVYAVGIKISVVLALVIGALKTAWFPISLDAVQEEKGKRLIRNASCVYLGLGFSAAIIISFIAPFIIQIIATPGYFKGHLVVGMLSLFLVLDGYLGISQLGLLKNKKTYLLTLFAVVSTCASFLTIYLLVPILGFLGAAIGMLVGVILRNILSHIISEAYYHVNFLSHAIILQFFLALVTILNQLIFGSNLYSFLFSCVSISLIIFQTYQNSEVFRSVFERS
jgi:O-antigen/teichoic acid export membrane protein